jgi:hypothetical protein
MCRKTYLTGTTTLTRISEIPTSNDKHTTNTGE